MSSSINAIFAEWASICTSSTEDAGSILANAQTKAQKYFADVDSTKDGNGQFEKEFAMLLAAMEGPISSSKSTNFSKVIALKYFYGGLQGINTKNRSDQKFSLKFAKAFSKMLLSLCGPIIDLEYNLDHDVSEEGNADIGTDDVRDSSMLCVSALLKTPLYSDKDDSSISERIIFRVRLAQKALIKRCASLEDCDDDEDDDFDEDDESIMQGYSNGAPTEEEGDMLSGLSLLPRAKRSLCFSVLESCLTGIQFDKNTKPIITQFCSVHLVRFCEFSATCLIGETDPRCLMQMLHLLNNIQILLCPLIEESNKKTQIGTSDVQVKGFPHTSIFDAVAIYYPIRFQPPKNDPHGITKEGLQKAVMSIFTFASDLMFEPTTSGPDSDRINEANMTILATGLFLERLSPPKPYDPFGDDNESVDESEISTVIDRLEALEDLSCLLQLEQKSEASIALKKLNTTITKEMSNVLYRCHDDAATNVASAKSEEEKGDWRKLADDCRSFITKVANRWENLMNQSPNDDNLKSCWEIFVKDRIVDLVGLISSSPQSLKGRMGVGYLAAFAAAGTEKTLRLCIDGCMPRLLALMSENIQSSDETRDYEKTSTVIYSASVLFSSSQISVESMRKLGINIHPHPMQLYAEDIVEILCQTIDNIENENLNPIEIASIKALESILPSLPKSIINDTSMIKDTIQFIAKLLMSSNTSQLSKVEYEWKSSCANLLGLTIGNAVHGASQMESGPYTPILQVDDGMKTFVNSILLPKMVESCSEFKSDEESKNRYDWVVLNAACQTNHNDAIHSVISSLFNSLISSLQRVKSGNNRNDVDRSIALAKALSKLLGNGNEQVIATFHSKNRESNLFNILSSSPNTSDRNEEAMEGMNCLLLPEDRERLRLEVKSATNLSLSILPSMLIVFRNGNDYSEELEWCISRLSQALPPLSDWDSFELCTIFPVLSSILKSDMKLRTDQMQTLQSYTSDIIEYVLGTENPPGARSAAATSVHYIIAGHEKRADACLGIQVLKAQLCPLISTNMVTTSSLDLSERILNVSDAMNLVAGIGLACSQRGGSSAITLDEIARYFVLVACEGAVKAPNLGVDAPLDCCINDGGNHIPTTTIAAKALGSMLANSSNPFVKQRLAHKILPVILSSTVNQNSTLSQTKIGTLFCASYIINCLKLKAIGKENIEVLISILVNGLEIIIQHVYSNDCDKNETLDGDLIPLLLSALVKLFNETVLGVVSHIGSIVPSLLFILITKKDVTDAPINLLSLQILSSLASSGNDAIIHFCKTYKMTVVQHLSESLDHPSYEVRRAAMEMANEWSLLG